ncbi:uncharacterized protein SEPMUDRAFT_120195 [Sphaerulina musiva SO2202]|uniref:Uncharacterized protein n=1 Tax=Sphaerulina musiva (strain SO2202) TaxID=692275 RepID=N1QEF5_SPHMS|nr:uncharacterized protein SEPMUDRAFT_120195 [Sphaerulina musiva SO2202]EMF09337.1 hypothetical protein SEPMUDRAFT_120195 [Sphaerulina musiva SO2202]
MSASNNTGVSGVRKVASFIEPCLPSPPRAACVSAQVASRKAELCSAFCKHQRKHYVDIQHITDNAPDEQTDPSSQPRTEVPCADIYMYHAIFVAAQLK